MTVNFLEAHEFNDDGICYRCGLSRSAVLDGQRICEISAALDYEIERRIDERQEEDHFADPGCYTG